MGNKSKKKLIAVIMSVAMACGMLTGTNIQVKAATQADETTGYWGGFWILYRNEERPESFDEYSNCKWYWGDWGKIKSEETHLNNEKAVSNMILQVPKVTKALLKDGEEVHWFSSKKRGYRFQIYGEIVKKDTSDVKDDEETVPSEIVTPSPTVEPTKVPTPTPTVEPTKQPTSSPTVKPTEKPDLSKCCWTGFQVLKLGEKCPASLAEISQSEWMWGDFGYLTKCESIYNQQTVSERIISVPNKVKEMLKEDEDIHWFAIRQQGYGWRVYGEIYNVNVEKSIEKGAVQSKEKEVVVENVSDIEKLNKVYESGTVIRTLGFYKKGDGGAATYEIANRSNEADYANFVTKTGQHVNYVVENNTINMKQLGAGVCEENNNGTVTKTDNDDAKRLNVAIELIDDYENGTIYFPAGEYRCASKVYIGGDNYTIKGSGNKSILYTDNGYQGDEHFLTVLGDSITLDGFRVEARETKWVPYYRQCSVMFASNINILNCEFSVQENVISYNKSRDRQYTNITLYTGWHNVTIDNCVMEQMGCVERGACLGIIDMWSNGCSGASVTNCTMRQNAHDEMIGIFTKTGANASISDIYIANNKMYTASASNVSKKTMAITMAYDESKQISNIRFVNNYVKAEVPSNFMTFGSLADCVIKDNVFDIVHTGSSYGGVMFDARTGVTVENNKINISSDVKNGGIMQIFKRDGVFKNNDVNCECYVYAGSYMGGKLIGNNIKLEKGCHAVAITPEEFKENNVTVTGKVDNFIHYDGLEYDSIISGNEFDYDYDDSKDEIYPSNGGSFIYAGFHAGINGHTVTVTSNKIQTSNQVTSKNKSLLCYGVGNTEPQTFRFKDNQVGLYRWVRSLYGQNMEKVTLENNYDKAGNSITKDEYTVFFNNTTY